jgi:hypothetical protein
LKEEDGVLVCGSSLNKKGCPEGELYTAANGCVPCEDVTGPVTIFSMSSCSMCPNLVQVSKWQCAPACTDPDAIVVDGICRCPLDRPLFNASQSTTDNQCLPCDYNGQTCSRTPYGSTGSNFTGYYCNRRSGGGYSNYCAPGTVGVSINQSIILKDGTVYKETASFGSCKPCSEVDVSALEYQASCESCGGTWVGDSWDNGSCEP